ncbi:MAG: cell division protein FtsZ [Melioribacter sp.]|nr:cell division protein FtsZ [Melioribacter sp.]
MTENNNKSRLRFVTLDREETQKLTAVLKVVGVGGGGCNAIDSMINRGLSGVEFIAINTDAQALARSLAPTKVQIGANITRGLGTGAIPSIGKKAAEEDRDKLTRILDGSDMVFVTCGMGGGTGTGAAPIVASIAKSLGALVVGIVTKPFSWEGKQRMKNAEEGIKELKQYVDSLIVVPNSRILSIVDSATAAVAAFDKPNEILYEATRGIADIITMTGIINVDFADVRTVMKESGQALMGCGIASGENRAIEAAQKAISSPLLEGISIKGAKNILLNVSGSSNMTMQEIEAGNNIIFEAAGEEANVIFGVVVKEELNDYISYTVIATGFGANGQSNGISSINKQNLEDKIKNNKTSTGIGGFHKNISLDNVDDLNIPTILRMKRKDPELFPDDNFQTGFKTDSNFENLKDEPNNKKNGDNDGEEDSSSFLRKIMD